MDNLFLSNSQKFAFKEIENGNNVFITGPAGTGKSYLLNYLREIYKNKKFYVTSSTGISAINIGGQTIHSWAGIGTGELPVEEIINQLYTDKKKKILTKIKNTKILAIDEISMISASLFDKLNYIFKELRENEFPFGGIQLVLFGDFLQLPPIIKNKEESEFCFESNAWKEANIKTIHLKENHRQKDEIFINLLSNLRFGKITNEDKEILKNRCNIENNEELKPIVLVSKNIDAMRINQTELDKLTSKEIIYKASYEGDEKKIEILKKNCLAYDELKLKIGAQVIMLKNTTTQSVMNGSMGIVRDFNTKTNFPIVEFKDGITMNIEPTTWEAKKWDANDGKEIIEATLYQIPLIPAWAITIHKSQGMTLDKVKCHLKDVFSEGQVYVAISRCKTLNGLYIEDIDFSKIKVNQKVIDFYEKTYFTQ